LCAAIASESAPIAATSTDLAQRLRGVDVDVRQVGPARRALAIAALTGPRRSRLTITIATTAAPCAARATASGSMTPSGPGSTWTAARASPSRVASAPTAACSIDDITIAPGRVRAAPSTASASASVQPLVHTMSPIRRSPVVSPNAASSRRRAISMWPRAALPCGCCELGFPHAVRITSVIAASTRR
jgi:hypothetical protein